MNKIFDKIKKIPKIQKARSAEIKPYNYIHIIKENMIYNLTLLRYWAGDGRSVFPVLKSNAYGHGIKQTIQILKTQNLDMVVVDDFGDYAKVYASLDTKILILHENNVQDIDKYDLDVAHFVVYDIPTFKKFKQINEDVNIHLFVDIWANMKWVHPDDIDTLIDIINSKDCSLTIDWLCSQLVSADKVDKKNQLDNFKNIHSKFLNNDIDFKYKHIGWSKANIQLTDDLINVYRPWIALYWYNPLTTSEDWYNKSIKLKPCMDVYSTILAVHTRKPWDEGNYVDDDMKLGLIPFGYTHWLKTKLSSNLRVQIDKKYCPVRGKIDMNSTTIQIDNDIEAWVPVRILSSKSSHRNSIVNVSNRAKMNIKEFLVKLDKDIYRKIV